MKKLLLAAVLIAISFTSCKSNEEKALALIDKQMFKTLYDYESYQPIETIVTEANSSIYTDSLIRKYAIRTQALKNLYDKSYKKNKDALDYADIYVGSYSASGNRKFDEYMSQAKKEYQNMVYYSSQLQIYKDSIKLLVSNFQPQRIGWEVTHKFRCKTKGGNSSIGDYVYIMDDKFTTIIDQFDMDDEDEMAVRERIDIAIKEEE